MKNHSSRGLICVVLAALIFVSACSAERKIRRKAEDLTESLTTAANEFNRMVAWRYFTEASDMVVPEARAHFLMSAELVGQRVNMEGFAVTLVQVNIAPFPRTEIAVLDVPKPDVAAIRDLPPDADESKPADFPKKVPKRWYGIALVRYVNMSIAPSNKVLSPLVRQYWYWDAEADAWFVDPQLDELLKLGDSAAPAAPPPDIAPPLVPAP